MRGLWTSFGNSLGLELIKQAQVIPQVDPKKRLDALRKKFSPESRSRSTALTRFRDTTNIPLKKTKVLDPGKKGVG